MIKHDGKWNEVDWPFKIIADNWGNDVFFCFIWVATIGTTA